jgi:hypothetical protein
MPRRDAICEAFKESLSPPITHLSSDAARYLTSDNNNNNKLTAGWKYYS